MKRLLLILIIGAPLFMLNCARTNAQIITTIAGNGASAFGGDGGQATAGELYDPVGVIVDDSGNVYVADSHNGAIRKISGTTGVITTVAGSGVNGAYSGNGVAATSALLNDPQQICLDDSGNIYFADYGNMVIRKITISTGIITTIAGTPTVWSFSGDGGQATAAKLSVVTGVAVDDSFNVYIADQWNHRIRKVTKATGIINTIAGTGTEGFNGNGILATTAELAYPTGIVVDDSENVYFTDAFNNEVRKITTATGIISDFAGNPVVTTGLGTGGFGGDGGQATAAQLNYPNGIFRDDSGNFFIGDWNNEVIREISNKGIINTVAGDGFGRPTSNGGYSGDGGPATDAELNAAEYAATDKCGNIYISDMFNQRIRKVTVTDTATITITPNTPTVCGGGGALLVASGATNYTWTPSTGLSTTTGDSVIAAPTITTTYTINGTTTIGCASNGSTTVVVTVGPSLAIAVQPPAPSVCAGQALTLTASGGTSYLWNNGVNDSTITITTTKDTAFYVTGSNGTCNGTDTVNVSVIAAPPLTVLPQAPYLCGGASTVLYVNGGGSNFIWTPGTGITDSTTTGDSVTTSPTVNTTYTVTGIDSIGCPSSGTDVVTIVPAPNKPTITVSVTGDSLISSAGSYNQWNFDGTAINDSTRNILIIKGHIRGYYSVTVTNPANGCTTTSDSTTSINQLSIISDQLSIYPNPFNNYITVKINSSVSNVNEWNLRLTDVLGRTLLTVPSLNYSNELNLSNFSSGMYFIEVINKADRAVFTVVKQN